MAREMKSRAVDRTARHWKGIAMRRKIRCCKGFAWSGVATA